MNKREYMRTNAEWLAEKAKEEGVMALPRGIYYKVLAEGNNDGRHPSPRSIITAHYTGKTINGKKLDSSRGSAPLAMRLSDLIDGWIVAMQHMCIGDRWEVYIPAEMGIWQVLTTRHPRRLYPHLRYRINGNWVNRIR